MNKLAILDYFGRLIQIWCLLYQSANLNSNRELEILPIALNIESYLLPKSLPKKNPTNLTIMGEKWKIKTWIFSKKQIFITPVNKSAPRTLWQDHGESQVQRPLCLSPGRGAIYSWSLNRSDQNWINSRLKTICGVKTGSDALLSWINLRFLAYFFLSSAASYTFFNGLIIVNWSNRLNQHLIGNLNFLSSSDWTQNFVYLSPIALTQR